MEENKVLLGISGVGVVLILMLALLWGRGAEVTTVDQAISALDERLAAVEGSVEAAQGETAEQLAAAEARMSDLEGAVGAASKAAEDSAAGLAALQTQVDEAGAATSAAMAEMEDRVAASVATAVASAAAAAPAVAAPVADATTAKAEPVHVSGEPGFMPGQTAVLGDGALRVFVSRLMPEDGAARLSIHGAMDTYAAGTSEVIRVGKDYCELTVDAVSSDGALMSALCGDALADPEGIGVGETVALADGALRVFASRVTDDGARLSVNGTLTELGVGRSVAAMAGEERCRVYLDGVGRGHAQVSSVCGADIKVSDPITPGATALLGDGKARVFLSAVDDAAQNVRFAVNGQAQHMGGSGFEVAVADGCFVTVEDVATAQASFSYSCGK